tara:strand:+ start:3397 stop:4929 length:1533 start_codon:yes stop_codon:yes gene_type:complete
MSQSIASKFISLVPTNGTEFTVSSGQKVIFEVQPSLGLVKGRDSYLVFDILNNCSDNRRIMLSNTAGAMGIVSRCDIYSLRTGQHLETMQNINQMYSLANQYLFEDKTNLQALQGCGDKVFAKEDNGAGSVPVVNSSGSVNNNLLSPINGSAELVANFRRYTVPLKAGILRYWDEERLCNVMGLQGLRIELTLESPEESCFIMSAEKSDGSKYLLTDGVECQDTAGATFNIRTKAADSITINKCGFAVGNQVAVTSNIATVNTTINAIQDVGGGETQFTLADQIGGVATGVKIQVRGDTRALKVRPQFRVLTVAPPPSLINEMMKGFQYEFTTYDHYVDNIPANARKHLIELNSVATRAVCVMSQFSDVSKLGGENSSSYYGGEVPNDLNLNSVVYFLKSRLVPVRPYDPRINNEKIVAVNELVKSWNSVNKEAKDLGNQEGKNGDIYTNTFLIGRQLARSPYYYDLGNAEGQIRLGFSAARTNDTLADTFIWSRKIINVSESGGVQVVL